VDVTGARGLFPPGARVAFLHAHPDDETLATGVLIAELAASGHPVAVVTATRGERGEIRPGVDVGTDLVAHREGELACALAALGVIDHSFLGTPPAFAEVGGTRAVPEAPGRFADRARQGGTIPDASAAGAPGRFTDSGMRWVTPELAGPAEDAGADSLTAAGVDGPAAHLVAYLRAWRADLLVSYDAHGGYGHPDHVACHEIAVAASAASGVPLVEVVSEPLLPVDGALAWHAPEQLPSVRRALGCYASQLEVDGDEVVHVGGQRQPIADTVWLRPAAG
jgi:N-acetyl-1-D-myo-inositol-2-amino-2-deoxy-alpha-D-glucopyranoside deacetylase